MEILYYVFLIVVIMTALYVIFFRKKRKKSTTTSTHASSTSSYNSKDNWDSLKQDPYPYVGHDYDVTVDVGSFDENISSNASDILLPDVDTDFSSSGEDNEVKFGGGMTGGGGAGGDWSSNDDYYSSDSGSDFDITD